MSRLIAASLFLVTLVAVGCSPSGNTVKEISAEEASEREEMVEDASTTISAD